MDLALIVNLIEESRRIRDNDDNNNNNNIILIITIIIIKLIIIKSVNSLYMLVSLLLFKK